MRRRFSLVPVIMALVTSAAQGGTPAPVISGPDPSGLEPLSARPVVEVGGGTNASVAEFERLLNRLDAEEKALRAELDRIGPELETTRTRMRARGRAYYKQVRAGLLPVGGGFDALVDHAAKVERMRRSLERDVAREAELLRRSAEIGERLGRLRAERAPYELQREAMEKARAALAAESERRAAFERAFESSVRPDYVAIYGADVGPSDDGGHRGFSSMKGRLPFPVAGRAEVRRVSRHGGPGLELAAAPAVSVRCVAPGRAVYAERHQDYGLTVIVDHGDRYYSLYGSLGGTELRVGDPIAGGGRIGTSSSDRGTVYFELRHGPEIIDPSPWLGL